MSSIVSRVFPIQTIIVSAIVFVNLNTFLPLPLPLQTEAIKHPFKLQIILEKSTFELGEPIDVTWILTNIGDEYITLYTSIDRVFDFRVRNKNFRRVYYYGSNIGTTMLVEPYRPIKPDANKTITRSWYQKYGWEYIWPEDFRIEFVPPGIYYIEGVFHSPTYKLTMKTPMIRITIL